MRLASFMFLSFLFFPVFSQVAPKSEAGLVLKAGYEFWGGDKVGEIQYSNGTRASIYGGEGLALAAGGYYRPADSKLEFLATVGIKNRGFKSVQAGSVNYNRTTLDARVNYRPTADFWFGAGPTFHTGNRFKFADAHFSMKPALGLTAEAGWKCFYVSYTSIAYNERDSFCRDASCLGAGIQAKF